MKLLLLLLTVSLGNCANILMILTIPTYNHHNIVFRLVKELANRQHQVTFISPYPSKDVEKNYEFLSTEDTNERLNQNDLVSLIKKGTIGRTIFDTNLGLELTENTLRNPKFQKVLNSTRKFDLVVIEQFFNEAVIGLGHRFNAPVIILSPVSLGFRTHHLVGAPAPSSYVVDSFSAQTEIKTFWQRLNNFFVNNVIELIRRVTYFPKQEKLLKKYINPQLDLDQAIRSVSLVLCNSHSSLYDPIPLMPSVINIGGYHIYPSKKLPEYFQSYLDNAQDGVILFSMGSTVNSKNLNPELLQIFLKVFSKIKQKVLWKFEDNGLQKLPENVKIVSWLPQQDVLAHPNVKAFITHGGISSIIETIYFGVPIIGIPAFADQPYNVATAVRRGCGVGINMGDLTENRLFEAIQEVINEPKYQENIKNLSKLIQDQPIKPMETAIYWIEYVIRHKGAPYMRSQGLDLKWYQRQMIDIVFFLTAATVAILITLYSIIKKFTANKAKIVTSKKDN